MSDLETLIEAIHSTSRMVVIEFAGAGAQALAWLHGVGGSSRTILEATDRYASASVVDLIGFEPEQFTALNVARAMATGAYIRASQLADPGISVAGVGCTATIATERHKRGDHRCCVAVCDAQSVTTYELTMVKGARSRKEEENLVSRLIVQAVARTSGLIDPVELPLSGAERVQESVDTVDLLTRLIDGDFDLIVVSPQGEMVPVQKLPDIALLSGAFNPLHQGHLKLAQVAAGILKKEVYFELPLINAGKGSIDPDVARQRVAQFFNIGSVILTRAPLYSQKAAQFPHSVFVVGADKVEQLFQLKFYNNDPAEMRASFDTLQRSGCRFLVAGRLHHSQYLTLPDLELPVNYSALFEPIPMSEFRVDISSTTLRQRES